MIYETYSPEETKQIAVNMGINANVGDIFCLLEVKIYDYTSP